MAQKSTRKNSTVSNVGMGILTILLTVVLVAIAWWSLKPLPAPVNMSNNDTSINTPAIASVEENTTNETIPTDVEMLPFELHQIDVGCANAYLIRYDNSTVFIDGGQSFSWKTVNNYLSKLGITSIDIYINTHWHGDHADNMSKLLETYGHPATLVYGTSASPNDKYPVSQGFYIQFENNDSFQLGDVTFTCVGPYEVKNAGTSNYDSLNIIIQYNDFKVFITGDYVYDQAIVEHSELTKDVDILQMPHHGLEPLCMSKTALEHCNPSLILVPANSSTPTNKIVRELNMEATVLNNQSGCIVIVTYGDDYEVYTGVIASDFEY